MEELQKAMRYLKGGKAADANGIVAEMLKAGGRPLREALLDLFNTILQPTSPTPRQWQHTLIKVIYKSGDPKLPQNYRPIATIPILYKLFSRLLYNRLEPALDKQQSRDQAGFRCKRGTTDHLFTTMILQEIADEWQIPIWSAAIDFKKAFDSVSHEALWTALADQGIDDTYICLLSKLYADQTAAVKIDCTSKFFNIDRGVKQGDPLSSLLVNCVSESLIRKLKVQWRSKRYGLQLQPHPDDTLYNLRFADDILLLSTTLPSVTNMIAELSEKAPKLG